MNHGRLRELEWQVDDLWRQMGELLVELLEADDRAARWYALLDTFTAAQDELLRAL